MSDADENPVAPGVLAENYRSERMEPTTKPKRTRAGILLQMPAVQAEVLRRLAAKMGLSQQSLREELEKSPIFADAITRQLRKQFSAWQDRQAKDDVFAGLKEENSDA